MKRRKVIKTGGAILAASFAGCMNQDASTTTDVATIIDYEVIQKVNRVGIKIRLKEERWCDARWVVFLKWGLHDAEETSYTIEEGFEAVTVDGTQSHTIWIDTDPSDEYRASVRQISQQEYWNETGDKINYPRCPGDI